MAILLVIASHTVDHLVFPGIAEIGHVGVLIFFALSGFLITDRLLAEYRSTGKISLRNFYVRRTFRILPAAVTFLAIVWGLSLAGVVICNPSAIRAALFFYMNYAFFDASGWRVEHFWSLSVEEHFYAFWPFLLVVFGVRKGWRVAAFVAISLCTWRVLDNHTHILARVFSNPYLAADGYRTDLIADVLLWGCCLAFYLRRPGRVALNPGLSTVVALCSAALLCFLCVAQIDHVTPLKHILPAIMLGAVVASPQAPIGRLLELAPLRILGTLSYSLYIWQQLFLGGPDPRLPTLAALVLIPACAYLSYRFVEQPCIRFGRRLTGRPSVVAS